ncbi:unnamed protein product [Rotaria sp. Silwood2]|nr:unnamed protein product [Rotaria sp. Silwood2]CAF2767059.1 unnamed protein product [Rotaria sp. Silwood2]CAF3188187.1 unnamed protein product [Rotaria sp. Silwood2]CAF4017386.1 unnamed protein product [Rotaria sp. Silwood2]CAF4077443.1 unnamed protein product [Rotaria sp. Silwood2]
MTTDKKIKKRCVKCDDYENTNGLFICDGCQNMLCTRHVNQHREELSNQLEIIVQEHDLIQQQISQISSNHILIQKINDWEKSSIIKIQKTAEKARNDLQQIINHSKQRSSKMRHDIATNLHSARKTDNFSEIDLEQWQKQLNKLKIDIDLSTSCNLVKDNKRSSIYLIQIEANNIIEKNSNVELPNHVNDKFGFIFGPVQLDRTEMHSTYIGDNEGYGRIRGQQKYFYGRSIIRFKIERTRSSQQLFFGITTQNADLDQRLWSDPSTIGWCGDNSIWQHGCHDQLEDRFFNNKFQIGDILQLILNCDQKQIELYNERTDKRHIQHVDMKQTPFPWQFLVGLYNYGDCVIIV